MSFRVQFRSHHDEVLVSEETFPLREAASLFASEVILAEPQRCHVLTESGQPVQATAVDPHADVEIIPA